MVLLASTPQEAGDNLEYTVDEVIEALRAEGFSDEEFLRYAVPLLGYESKSLEMVMKEYLYYQEIQNIREH